jgi:predicted metal-dependent enzyme (double-stranded beta helix superfamily)
MSAPIVIETIKRVRSILDEEGLSDTGLERIAERMRWLVAHGDEVVAPESIEENSHSRRGLKPIYIDDSGLILTHGVVVPEQPTPVHSHGTWGVVGVYRGRDRYQVWRRHDDGTGAGPADVRLARELVLGPGDVIVIPPPPQDIHVQQGHGGETAYEFVLFGENVLGHLPHLVFDPARGYADEVHPRSPRSSAGTAE